MLADDFIDIGLSLIVIPNLFGIDHHHWAFLTTVEATGVIDTHFALPGQAKRLAFFLGVIAQVARASLAAGRATVVSLVGAKENVVFVVTHNDRFNKTCAELWLARSRIFVFST